jgi:hypothetical protein
MKFRFCAHDLRKELLFVAKARDPNDARYRLAVASIGCLGRLSIGELANAWLGTANFTPADPAS